MLFGCTGFLMFPGHIEQLQKSVDEDESKNVNSSTSAPSTETKAATSPNKPEF